VIREATVADLGHIVSLVAAFHAEPRWPEPIQFNARHFRATAWRLIGSGVILLSERGLLGLTVSPSLYNHHVLICSELFFWAPDGRGDELRRAGEAWAKSRASLLIMSAHEPGPAERIANWYRRAGYAPIGRQFAKVV
jgi:hypothetical protein